MQRRGNEISFGVWQRSHQSLGYRGRSMANAAYATGITISYRGCSATILFWIKSIYESAVDLQNPNLSGQQNHQSHNDLP